MLQIVANALLLALLLAPGIGVAVWCAGRMLRGEPILDRAPRRAAPWGIVEIGMLVLALPPVQLGCMFIARIACEIPDDAKFAALTPLQQLALLSAGSAGMGLLAIAAVLLGLVRSDDWLGDMGWDMSHSWQDQLTGAAAFALLAPIVFAIQALVIQWQPSVHPLLEVLKTPEGARWFPLVVALAVVVAPLAEEVLFRWFLQGWLANFLAPSLSAAAMWFGREAHEEAKPTAAMNPGGPAPGDVQGEGGVERGLVPPYEEADTFLSLWPVALSAAIFALLHITHGPDWIPLFVFALGLGYLYQRTGRLLPSITLHFLLNATTMVGVWLQLRAE